MNCQSHRTRFEHSSNELKFLHKLLLLLPRPLWDLVNRANRSVSFHFSPWPQRVMSSRSRELHVGSNKVCSRAFLISKVMGNWLRVKHEVWNKRTASSSFFCVPLLYRMFHLDKLKLRLCFWYQTFSALFSYAYLLSILMSSLKSNLSI